MNWVPTFMVTKRSVFISNLLESYTSAFRLHRYIFYVSVSVLVDLFTDSQKNSIICIWEGSNYASLAVSFSCIVCKITCEDTEAEVHKCS